MLNFMRTIIKNNNDDNNEEETKNETEEEIKKVNEEIIINKRDPDVENIKDNETKETDEYNIYDEQLINNTKNIINDNDDISDDLNDINDEHEEILYNKDISNFINSEQQTGGALMAPKKKIVIPYVSWFSVYAYRLIDYIASQGIWVLDITYDIKKLLSDNLVFSMTDKIKDMTKEELIKFVQNIITTKLYDKINRYFVIFYQIPSDMFYFKFFPNYKHFYFGSSVPIYFTYNKGDVINFYHDLSTLTHVYNIVNKKACLNDDGSINWPEVNKYNNENSKSSLIYGLFEGKEKYEKMFKEVGLCYISGVKLYKDDDYEFIDISVKTWGPDFVSKMFNYKHDK